MTSRIAGFALVAALAFGSLCWIAVGGRLPRDDGPLAVDIKSLTNFKFDPDDPRAEVPLTARQLDGKQVVLEGFLEPTSLTNRNGRFTLIYNADAGSRYGRPAIQDRVFAAMPAGMTIELPDPWKEFRLSGTLHVGARRDSAGKVESVFRLDVGGIDPV